MRILVHYFEDHHPPLLSLSIHDAPHRRMHIVAIKQFRKALYDAMVKVGISMPIDHPVDLSVLFVNPASTDLGNSYLALERALDGKTLGKPTILTDDSLISKVTMSKYFPHGEKR